MKRLAPGLARGTCAKILIIIISLASMTYLPCKLEAHGGQQ